jgi:hypothetical protein
MEQLTISIAPDVKAVLQQRADEMGKDIVEYVESLVTKQAKRQILDEILAPIRKNFVDSGMTEEELDVLIESERQAMWEEKHGKRD